jgi:hypothetical protein
MVAAAIAVLLLAAPAHGFTVHNGAGASVFASGFEPRDGIGPIGIAFDGAGDLFVGSRGHLYRFGPEGGTAADHQVTTTPVGENIAGIAFGRGGRLYAARRHTRRLGPGDIVELDPRNGAVLRTLTGPIPCPTGLAVDPLTGDVFISTYVCGENVLRLHDPESDAPRTSVYIDDIQVDGLTFAPDGTLYAAHHATSDGATVSTLAATNSEDPGARTAVASVPEVDGAALGTPAPGEEDPPFVVINRTDGVVTKVDLLDPDRPQYDLVRDGSRGDLVAAGPDGCLYATQLDSVLKVTNADGSCRAQPGGPPPALGLGLQQTTMANFGTAPCTPRKRLRIRMRFRRHKLRVARFYVRGRRVRVYVRGRSFRTVRGRALRRRVNIRKVPRRSFRVKIRAKTRNGRRVVRKIRFAPCGRGVLSRRTRVRPQRT